MTLNGDTMQETMCQEVIDLTQCRYMYVYKGGDNFEMNAGIGLCMWEVIILQYCLTERSSLILYTF